MPGRKTAPRKSRQPRHEQPKRPVAAPDLPTSPAPTGQTGERPVGTPTSVTFLPPSVIAGTFVGTGAPPRRIRVSDAYHRLMARDISPRDLSKPDVAVKRALSELASQGPLKMADLVAGSVLLKALHPTARDAMVAAREITDRTEGPVVQKSQVVSARYVVSVSPTGALSESQPPVLSLSDWEAQAVEEDEAATARALAEASLAARAEGEE